MRGKLEAVLQILVALVIVSVGQHLLIQGKQRLLS
jgi:hypothetical protein